MAPIEARENADEPKTDVGLPSSARIDRSLDECGDMHFVRLKAKASTRRMSCSLRLPDEGDSMGHTRGPSGWGVSGMYEEGRGWRGSLALHVQGLGRKRWALHGNGV